MTTGADRKTPRAEEQLGLWPEKAGAHLEKNQHQKPSTTKRLVLRRRKNSELLIQLRFDGDVNRLIELLGSPQGDFSGEAWLTGTSDCFTDKLAKRIEAVCGLDKGWLDMSHALPISLATKISVLDATERGALEILTDALLHQNQSR